MRKGGERGFRVTGEVRGEVKTKSLSDLSLGWFSLILGAPGCSGVLVQLWSGFLVFLGEDGSSVVVCWVVRDYTFGSETTHARSALLFVDQLILTLQVNVTFIA